MKVKIPLKKGGLRGMFIRIVRKIDRHPSKSPLGRGDFFINRTEVKTFRAFSRFCGKTQLLLSQKMSVLASAMETTAIPSQPSIELFGVTIMEPMVTFTNFWITAVCVYAFLKLVKLDKKKGSPVHAPVLHHHGAGHFPGRDFGSRFSVRRWALMETPRIAHQYAFGDVHRSGIHHARPIVNQKFAKFLDIANVIELLTFAVISFYKLNFFYIQVHSAYGLGLVVLPLHFWVYWNTRNEGSRIIFLSVIFATLAAFFYTSEIGLHT